MDVNNTGDNTLQTPKKYRQIKQWISTHGQLGNVNKTLQYKQFVKLTYKNSVKDENHAHSGDGWDITMKAIGASSQTYPTDGYFALNNATYSTADSIKIH